MTRQQVLDYTSLAANRVLLNIYEADMLFLPRRAPEGWYEDFQRFYDMDAAVHREVVRRKLENYLFSFLEDEIDASGTWSAGALESWLIAQVEAANSKRSPVFDAILGSRNPEHAALTLMIQFAGDFLSEASAMARNILGNFGPAQSELFKIVIDEYGYGLHETKHSTLFEALMESIGLESAPHAYWQYYLTSSNMLNNYFHYVSKNHSRFFRYLGALYYTEATLSVYCRHASEVLTKVYGPRAAVRYFDEHVHIDQHHGRMALDKLVLPIVQQYGPTVIPEIVRGCAEFSLLASIADQDVIDQIAWSDGEQRYKQLHDSVYRAILAGQVRTRSKRIALTETHDEPTVTHAHDWAECLHIVSGTMRFVTGHDRSVLLHPGEGTMILANRLHGASIESNECSFEVYQLTGEYQK
jgi:mannose-6-phosphate isomerase-like protein (cupin superfamily)